MWFHVSCNVFCASLLVYSKTCSKQIRQMQALANRSEGFTGADLAALVQEAALAALKDSLQATVVQHQHFHQAFQASFQNYNMTLSGAVLSFQCLCHWQSCMFNDAPSVKPALQRTCVHYP